MTATYTMLVKVETRSVQEASRVTFCIFTEVITNTNFSIMLGNEDERDTEEHVCTGRYQ